jgi:hypothetical protein
VRFFYFKTVIFLTFNLLNRPEYKNLLILILFLGTLAMFHFYHTNIYYFNLWINKAITGKHAINFWTALIFLLAFFTYGSKYNLSIFLWIIGIIGIAVILVFRSESNKYSLILIDTNKF